MNVTNSTSYYAAVNETFNNYFSQVYLMTETIEANFNQLASDMMNITSDQLLNNNTQYQINLDMNTILANMEQLTTAFSIQMYPSMT